MQHPRLGYWAGRTAALTAPAPAAPTAQQLGRAHGSTHRTSTGSTHGSATGQGARQHSLHQHRQHPRLGYWAGRMAAPTAPAPMAQLLGRAHGSTACNAGS